MLYYSNISIQPTLEHINKVPNNNRKVTAFPTAYVISDNRPRTTSSMFRVAINLCPDLPPRDATSAFCRPADLGPASGVQSWYLYLIHKRDINDQVQ